MPCPLRLTEINAHDALVAGLSPLGLVDMPPELVIDELAMAHPPPPPSSTAVMELRERIATIDAALQRSHEVEIPGPPRRQSLDHRFDQPDPAVAARPAPTPGHEKTNPFDEIPADRPEPFYDSIAAKFGLGILDAEDFDEYIVYNAFVTNLRVCPVHLGDRKPSYYIEHRSFLPSTPGAILREGIDKSGRSLGASHLPLQGENRIGVGDFEHHPHDVVWERMGNAGFWTHMKYAFEHAIRDGERRTFHWIRTRNNLLDDQGDLVLVEAGRDEVLAEYLGQGLLKWKKRGRLRIRAMAHLGESWERVVLLSWASVLEVCKASRCCVGCELTLE
ncbi:unnamed protein product [Diplocarpon coronariae]